MKIRPLDNRILVRRLEEKNMTKGGIIIPDTAREKPIQGRVVVVGPGKKDEKGNRIPMEVSENDTVLFSKYAGSDIEIDGIEHVVMTEDDVLGITT